MIEIYTDGACRSKLGPDGWGVLLLSGKYVKELWGGAEHTTNTQMEMTAITRSHEALKKPSQVRLTTDTKYVLGGAKNLIVGWKKRN